MPNVTSKPSSDVDASQTLQGAFNDVDKTITINSFLVGLVGREITLVIQTTNVANDTELYTFLESGTQLYQFQIIYTDGTRTTLMSATRIS